MREHGNVNVLILSKFKELINNSEMDQTCTVKGGNEAQRQKCVKRIIFLVSSIYSKKLPIDEVPDNMYAIIKKAAKFFVTAFCSKSHIFFVSLE